MAAHKILVIDDSKVIRNMLRDMLPPANFEVLEAADGVKGLEMIQKEKPWMIMLDFLLPRMNGFEVYENLQQNRELKRIPLLLMSGRKQEWTSKIPEPFEDKYLVFIEKPFEQKVLIAAIKKAMALGQKRPPDTSVAAVSSHQVQSATSDSSQELLKQIEALDKRVKVLEQQVVNQHKQMQQLVDFIKKKIG
ncbi:response regulator [Tumidithrix elongata RA019]|uniref:Response regulator n=1 Tax=Tumidithrix elongata BACA0141 TaxID=2716417 RepID=A0AAW9PV98_9CYAN|nr:response regulator [Tumidithrix elongata RA019]